MKNNSEYDMQMETLGDINTDAHRRKRSAQNRQRSAEKPKRSVRRSPIIEFFTSKRMTLTLGIILTVLSVGSLIVTIDYLQSGPADMSLVVGNDSLMDIANSGEKIENAGGAFGAWFAHVMMVDGLGVGAFVLVVYMAVLACALFGLMRCRFWAFTFKCLFTAISLSIIFGLFTYNVETAFHWGGNHGRYVNQWLMHVSSTLGAICVSAVLIGLLCVMYLAQINSFIAKVSGRVRKAREAMAEAAAEGRATKTELTDIPEADEEERTKSETIEVSEVAIPEPQQTLEPQRRVKPIDEGFSVDETSDMPDFTIKTAAESQENSENPLPNEAPELTPLNIRDELSHYRFPGLDLLIDRPQDFTISEEEHKENNELIVKTLKQYNIPIAKIEATVGPTITLYEIVPAEGVRIAQIKRLEDDIALSLAALGIRIIAPMPGKGTIGIEVPNRKPQTVSMYSIINSRKFRESKMALPMALGSTISNEVFIEDLAKMPHLLVAGATGQGKSVGLNCIIASLLYKKHPGELKFVLIDPKMVEFSLYNKIESHYLAKLPMEEDAIVTDPQKALDTLKALCVEMDQRYELLKSAGVRTVEEYNTKFCNRRLNPEKGHRYMPYMVVIVDEFADLIMTAGKDISTYIARIAQKARAVGMHMIIATQRPSTDIITGMIKANFPARIAFRCASMVDSKTILDRPGANRLIGRGDLLFSHSNKLERVQCAFIDTPEVEAMVDFISRQTGYGSAYLLPEPVNENSLDPGAIDLSKRDDLFDDCARFIVQNDTASTSSLQRRFGIGYNKAGKIMDQLEAAGVVGPADGQRPRRVLVDSIAIEDLLRSL